MKALVLVATLAGALTATAARADADTFDSTGWTLLGETKVDGKRDTDVIEVGRKEGRFTKLTVVVLDDDLEMTAMTVELGNGDMISPELRQHFEEGSRSRAIDLPGESRGIKAITLTYGEFGRKVKVRDHRRKKRARREAFTSARVQVWGMTADESAPEWSSSGWVTLGSKEVTGKKGTAKFKIRNSDAYDRITLKVVDGDVRITGVVVAFKRGKKSTVEVDRELGTRGRHLTFEVPADGRPIKSIHVKYASRRGGRGEKRSTIEVYGRIGADEPADTIDTSGWTLLGEETVDGKRDRDVIDVGRDEGKFDKLLLVVLDDDIEMNGIVIKLRRGELTPELKHEFKAGQRSREIDLGVKAAVIKQVELSYGNKRPRSKARVQIWAR